MIRKRLKRKYYYLITIFLVFFFFLIILNIYINNTKDKLLFLAEEFLKKEVDHSLNNLINANDYTLDVLKIYKNKNDEILYVDYDLNKSYELLNEITNEVKKRLDKNSYPSNGIIITIPFLAASNNIYYANVGPKIRIKMNYVDSILTNIHTKIKNYGLNNALVEAYIDISIEGLIISPISSKKVLLNYSLLISSKIINGRIPEVYGQYLTSNSSIFDVPINK